MGKKSRFKRGLSVLLSALLTTQIVTSSVVVAVGDTQKALSDYTHTYNVLNEHSSDYPAYDKLEISWNDVSQEQFGMILTSALDDEYLGEIYNKILEAWYSAGNDNMTVPSKDEINAMVYYPDTLVEIPKIEEVISIPANQFTESFISVNDLGIGGNGVTADLTSADEDIIGVRTIRRDGDYIVYTDSYTNYVYEFTGVVNNYDFTMDAKGHGDGAVAEMEGEIGDDKILHFGVTGFDDANAVDPLEPTYDISKTALNKNGNTIDTPYVAYEITASQTNTKANQIGLAGTCWEDVMPDENSKLEFVSVEFEGNTFYRENIPTTANVKCPFSYDKNTRTLRYEFADVYGEGDVVNTKTFIVNMQLTDSAMREYFNTSSDSTMKILDFENTVTLSTVGDDDGTPVKELDTDTEVVNFELKSIIDKDGMPISSNSRYVDWTVNVNSSSNVRPSDISVYLLDTIYISQQAYDIDNGVKILDETGAVLESIEIVDVKALCDVNDTSYWTEEKISDLYKTLGDDYAGKALVIKTGETQDSLIIPMDREKSLFKSVDVHYQTVIDEQTYSDGLEAGVEAELDNSVALRWNMWWYGSGIGTGYLPDFEISAHRVINLDYELVTKEGAGYNQDDHTLTWYIWVNQSAVDFTNLVITDVFENNKQGLIQDEIKVEKADREGNIIGTADASVYSVDVSSDNEKTTLKVEFGSVSKSDIYRITVKTKLNDVNIIGKNVENKEVSNSVLYTADLTEDISIEEKESNTAKIPNISNKIFEKNVVKNYNYLTHETTWSITFNQSRTLVEFSSITDYLPDNTTFTGFTSVSKTKLGKDTEYARLSNDKTQAIFQEGEFGAESITGGICCFSYAGDITDCVFTIEFTTKYDSSVLESDKFLSGEEYHAINEASLNAKAYTGDNVIIDDDANAVIKAGYSQKTGKFHMFNTGDRDDEDYHETYIDWELVFNRNSVDSENWIITDTLEKIFTLNTDSLKVYTCDVTEDGEYINSSLEDITSNLGGSLKKSGRSFSITVPEVYKDEVILVRFRTYVVKNYESVDLIKNTITIKPDDKDSTSVTFDKENVDGENTLNWDNYVTASKRPRLVITKLANYSNSTQTGIKLSDVEFTLQEVEYDEISQKFVNVVEEDPTVIKTSNLGLAGFNLLKKGVVYKLSETDTPSGYKAIDPMYFYWKISNTDPNASELEEKGVEICTTTSASTTTAKTIANDMDGNGNGYDLRLNKQINNMDISDVKFTLTHKQDKNYVIEATTSDSGIVTFRNLNPGEYTLKEERPDGIVDDGTFTVTVSYDSANGFTCSIKNDKNSDFEILSYNDSQQNTIYFIKNTYAYAGVSLTKVSDVNTNNVLNNDENGLVKGAIFGVYEKEGNQIVAYLLDDNSDGVYDKLSLNADGQANITAGVKLGQSPIVDLAKNKIVAGKYYVQEIVAPYGFEKNSGKFEFTVNDSSNNTIIKLNVKENVEGNSLEINKKIENASMTEGYSKGTGYKFMLTKVEDYDTNGNLSLKKLYPALAKDSAVSSDKDQIVLVTDSTGKAKIGTLPRGKYELKEIDSTNCGDEKIYNTIKTVYTITVSKQGEYIAVVEQQSNDNFSYEVKQGTNDLVFTAKNNIKRSNIQGTKLCEKLPIDGTYVGKAGVTMGLFAKSNDARIAIAETDANGVYKFENVYFGDFYVKEVTALDGYDLSNEKIEVSVKQDGATIQLDKVIYDNISEKQVEVKKYTDDTVHTQDAVERQFKITAKSLVISGTKLGDFFAEGDENVTVDSENGNVIYVSTKAITDGNNKILYGLCNVDLPYGTYTIEEVDTGDYKATGKQNFEIKESSDSKTIVEFRNDVPLIDIELEKKVEQESMGVNPTYLTQGDFTFKVTADDTSIAPQVVTTVNGKITIKDLRPGKYTVEEIDSERYVNSGKAYLVVEYDGENITCKLDGKSRDSYSLTGTTLTVKNNIKRSNIQGTKLCEKLPIDGTYVGKAGVTMGLFAKSNDARIAIAETDANGVYKFENVYFGDFYVKEVTALDGYDLSNEKIEVSVKQDGATIQLDKVIYDNISEKQVEVKKYTDDTVHTQDAVERQFKITAKSLVIDGKKLGDFFAEGDENVTVDSENGNVIYVSTKATFDVDGKVINAVSGEIKLPLGEYSIEEVDSGDYNVPPMQNFEIEENSSEVLEFAFFNEVPLTSITLNKKVEQIPLDLDTTGELKVEGEYSFTLIPHDNAIAPTVYTTTDGVVTISQLRIGKYDIVETDAKGYVNAGKATITIVFNTDKSALVCTMEKEDGANYTFSDNVLTATNILERVDITGVKLCENIKAREGYSGVAGVKLGLYNSNDKEIAQTETLEDGSYKFENVYFGSFYVKEISAPAGYNVSDEKVEVVVDSTEDVVLTKVIKDTISAQTVIIKKITDDEIYTQDAVERQFKITAKSLVIDGKKLGDFFAEGDENITVDSDDGNVIYVSTKVEYDEEENIVGAKTVRFVLPLGEYSIEEVDNGNYLRPAPQEFEVGEDTDTIKVVMFENIVPLADVKLVKMAEQTPTGLASADGEVINDGEFTFVVTPTDENILPTEYTTLDGEAVITGLRVGEYVIEEKDDDFYDNAGKMKLTVSLNEDNTLTLTMSDNDEGYEFDGEENVITVKNLLSRGNIVGEKRNYNDQKGISGVTIGLFAEGTEEYSEENAVETAVSDADGKFSFENIPYGNYEVRELLTHDGLIINEQVIAVTLGGDEQFSDIDGEPIKIVNTAKYGTLSITKCDSQDMQKLLSGAEFGVYTNDDMLVGKMVDLDEDGIYDLVPVDGNPMNEVLQSEYVLDNMLCYGEYYLQEMVAPVGYTISDVKYPFSVTQNGEEIVVNETNVIENSMTVGNINLTKRCETADGKTENGKGFKFVLSANDLLTGGNLDDIEVETDANGTATFENLPLGRYTLTELEVEGVTEKYILCGSVTVTIEVDDEQNVILTLGENEVYSCEGMEIFALNELAPVDSSSNADGDGDNKSSSSANNSNGANTKNPATGAVTSFAVVLAGGVLVLLKRKKLDD